MIESACLSAGLKVEKIVEEIVEDDEAVGDVLVERH